MQNARGDEGRSEGRVTLVEKLRLAIKEHGGRDRIALIRMSVIQEMLYRGLVPLSEVRVVKKEIDDEIIFPRHVTAAGIDVISDTDVPDGTIILEDRDGHELHRITGLRVPQPYSSDQE